MSLFKSSPADALNTHKWAKGLALFLVIILIGIIALYYGTPWLGRGQSRWHVEAFKTDTQKAWDKNLALKERTEQAIAQDAEDQYTVVNAPPNAFAFDANGKAMNDSYVVNSSYANPTYKPVPVVNGQTWYIQGVEILPDGRRMWNAWRVNKDGVKFVGYIPYRWLTHFDQSNRYDNDPDEPLADVTKVICYGMRFDAQKISFTQQGDAGVCEVPAGPYFFEVTDFELKKGHTYELEPDPDMKVNSTNSRDGGAYLLVNYEGWVDETGLYINPDFITTNRGGLRMNNLSQPLINQHAAFMALCMCVIDNDGKVLEVLGADGNITPRFSGHLGFCYNEPAASWCSQDNVGSIRVKVKEA